MCTCTTSSQLHIAISFGVISPQLVKLLELQRIHEPQTRLRLHETPLAEQLQGIEDGRFAGGLALTQSVSPTLRTQPLWREELGIMLPANSPLQSLDTVPLEEAARCPLVGWESPACDPVSTIVSTLFSMHNAPPPVASVKSYEILATLVAAGFGVGVGLLSRMSWTHMPNTVVRPLAGADVELQTSLVHRREGSNPAIDRLIERGQILSVAVPTDNLVAHPSPRKTS